MIKNIFISLVTSIVVIGAVLALTPVQKMDSVPSSLGSQIETTLIQLGGGVQVGGAGTKYSLVKSGTCTLLADSSIPATSTRAVDCAIPASGSFNGIRSGDIVRLNLQASTTLASQYIIKSSQASSTNGYASALLVNLTGGAAVPSATNGFGSSTVYQIFRPI